ncbi:hypothetical protein [Flagellimonas onchidii]|uniref:hypothetical protein n=1 Tax=Flagellimonas onchidii TaxID=2562684 RepID=UPI0010A5BE2E|nr:hypothetical protein [Allomuricauda onchidii]
MKTTTTFTFLFMVVLCFAAPNNANGKSFGKMKMTTHIKRKIILNPRPLPVQVRKRNQNDGHMSDDRIDNGTNRDEASWMEGTITPNQGKINKDDMSLQEFGQFRLQQVTEKLKNSEYILEYDKEILLIGRKALIKAKNRVRNAKQNGENPEIILNKEKQLATIEQKLNDLELAIVRAKEVIRKNAETLKKMSNDKKGHSVIRL